MTTLEIIVLAFWAGYLARYFMVRRECAACSNKRLQRREWDRTAHLDPLWDVLSRDPLRVPMSPVRPAKSVKTTPKLQR